MIDSPKSQAEAMARELWSEPRTFDATVTALEKLIAENERLKVRNEHLEEHVQSYIDANANLDNEAEAKHNENKALQSQLTATEARLGAADAVLRFYAERALGGHPAREYFKDHGVELPLPAFLSTLTAEKKEQG